MGVVMNGQQKYTPFVTLVDAGAVPLGLKHSEASFSPNRRIRCVYESLRYLDLELW